MGDVDGLPFKPGYRRMKIQGVQGPDDVASIREAVARRFHHIREHGETPPDILLIDGGLGQLHAAMAALGATAGLSGSDAVGQRPESSPTDTAGQSSSGAQTPVPFSPWAGRTTVISLAKREELVFTPDTDEPLHLSRHSFALRLLQYVRDEAHRFGLKYHTLLRANNFFNNS